ncbi:peptidoglycan-binding domain-containing protein [Streptomyces sp. NPDC050636]|uniref:peptidoglycan-binding domain-containing protein n=1 Tax=Streptomyces sp. NPDC050636 TaxID=3154510 RepID=UPI003437A2B4
MTVSRTGAGRARASRRAAVLAATVGLLTGGLLAAPAAQATQAQEPQLDTHAACTYYDGDKLTVYGQHGARVSQVQCLLANRHYLGWSSVTGNFGDKTLAAVKKFQSRHHLTADGKVGKKTWHALYYA